MSHAHAYPLHAHADPLITGSDLGIVDAGAWEVADGILFSVLASLVLWSFILASLYGTLS